MGRSFIASSQKQLTQVVTDGVLEVLGDVLEDVEVVDDIRGVARAVAEGAAENIAGERFDLIILVTRYTRDRGLGAGGRHLLLDLLDTLGHGNCVWRARAVGSEAWEGKKA